MMETQIISDGNTGAQIKFVEFYKRRIPTSSGFFWEDFLEEAGFELSLEEITM